MDLLTAVLHEMGHVLGLPDVFDEDLIGNIMNTWLEAGERRSPDQAAADRMWPTCSIDDPGQ